MTTLSDNTTTTPETSPAGAARERPVPCQTCLIPTWNFSGRCDDHLVRRCACGCGGIVTAPGRYLTAACFRADEPADCDEQGPFD